MKIFKFILIISITAMMLSSCWVALPSDGPPGAKEHNGRIYKLQRDILIVSYWLTPVSWEVDNQNTIGSNQEIRAKLKAGDEIKILSVKSFRLPSGIHYSFRCKDLKSKRKFDLQFSMLDCIGLPNNLIIKKQNANKSLQRTGGSAAALTRLPLLASR